MKAVFKESVNASTLKNKALKGIASVHYNDDDDNDNYFRPVGPPEGYKDVLS
jgi:hypothetical protein